MTKLGPYAHSQPLKWQLKLMLGHQNAFAISLPIILHSKLLYLEINQHAWQYYMYKYGILRKLGSSQIVAVIKKRSLIA